MEGPKQQFARTTVVLTETLKRNLDLLALRSRRPKGDVIREALASYISQQGLAPEKDPLVQVSYREEGTDVT